jgi:hypothetical protein
VIGTTGNGLLREVPSSEFGPPSTTYVDTPFGCCLGQNELRDIPQLWKKIVRKTVIERKSLILRLIKPLAPVSACFASAAVQERMLYPCCILG